MHEFDIIAKYLNLNTTPRKDVLCGVGDDCALLKVPQGQRLAVSMDTLIGDVHFPADADAKAIAHKAIAVNLSDLAACSAEPAWLTLSLSMPQADEKWLAAFSEGLSEMVEHFAVQLVGGDTCRGPLSITVQAHGLVPQKVFAQRSGAKAGDLVCVTGPLGDAALGLLHYKGELAASGADADYLLQRYLRPYPRVAAGIAMRGRASAAIDISDGLLADVQHLSNASGVGVVIRWDQIPLSDAARAVADQQLIKRAVLTGGDDYELCFTVPEDQFEATQKALAMVGEKCIPIGRISGKPGVRVVSDEGDINLEKMGYRHF